MGSFIKHLHGVSKDLTVISCCGAAAGAPFSLGFFGMMHTFVTQYPKAVVRLRGQCFAFLSMLTVCSFMRCNGAQGARP